MTLYTDYQNWNAHGSVFDEVAAATWAGPMDRILTGHGPAIPARRATSVDPLPALRYE